MTKQTITIGAVPNDGTGDPLRTAFTKVNANFTELYTADTVLSTIGYGAGGADTTTAVALNLTKLVHTLTSGWYSLADGVEGQICYFTLTASAAVPDNIIVKFAHARFNQGGASLWTGPNYSNIFTGTYPRASIITAIFTGGAWQCSPDGAWD